MEQDELLESFTFCQMQDGKEHNYRVTAHEHQYALEKDGKFIAEIKCEHGEWQQVGGNTLDRDLISQIGDRIEHHYE